MSEKTHQPSEQKKRKAREQGQLARSRLFTSAAVSLGGMVGLVVASRSIAAELVAWTTAVVGGTALSPVEALHDAVGLLARSAVLPVGLAVVAAVGASVAMVGLQLNPGLLAPKPERLNPAEGLKKLFSVQQLVEVLKGLAVTAVMTALMWSAVEDAAPAALRLLPHGGATSMVVVVGLVEDAVLRAAVVLVVLGVADLALARHKHLKELMMSHEEVKQEHKNSEGDPHHKAKRKSLHKQLATGGPARGVKTATTVVVNPTHIAVALRYDEAECDAPYIVARAREEEALQLRREAEALGIPVVRDVPLARSLVFYDVGEPVPEELYQAAAVVLAVALEASAKASPRTGR